ncbi:hypothetical protein RQP46_005042 [Phenoliferia psychrophenolica]
MSDTKTALRTGLGARLCSADVSATSFAELPIIDLGPLDGDATARKALALKVQNACITAGFFYVSNHGIPQEVLDAAFRQAKLFFSQPVEKKMLVDMRNGSSFKGYLPIGGEQVDPDSRGDLHEAFDIGSDSQSFTAEKASTGNQYPPVEDLPDFKAQTPEARIRRDSIMALGKRLFPLPEDYFDAHLTNPGSVMRLLFYPSQPQDGPIDPKELDDVFKSTVHRAINRSGLERYSIPFFFGVNYDATIEVLPNCVGEGRPANRTIPSLSFPITSTEVVTSTMEDFLNPFTGPNIGFDALAHDLEQQSESQAYGEYEEPPLIKTERADEIDFDFDESPDSQDAVEKESSPEVIVVRSRNAPKKHQAPESDDSDQESDSSRSTNKGASGRQSKPPTASNPQGNATPSMPEVGDRFPSAQAFYEACNRALKHSHNLSVHSQRPNLTASCTCQWKVKESCPFKVGATLVNGEWIVDRDKSNFKHSKHGRQPTGPTRSSKQANWELEVTSRVSKKAALYSEHRAFADPARQLRSEKLVVATFEETSNPGTKSSQYIAWNRYKAFCLGEDLPAFPIRPEIVSLSYVERNEARQQALAWLEKARLSSLSVWDGVDGVDGEETKLGSDSVIRALINAEKEGIDWDNKGNFLDKKPVKDEEEDTSDRQLRPRNPPTGAATRFESASTVATTSKSSTQTKSAVPSIDLQVEIPDLPKAGDVFNTRENFLDACSTASKDFTGYSMHLKTKLETLVVGYCSKGSSCDFRISAKPHGDKQWKVHQSRTYRYHSHRSKEGTRGWMAEELEIKRKKSAKPSFKVEVEVGPKSLLKKAQGVSGPFTSASATSFAVKRRDDTETNAPPKRHKANGIPASSLPASPSSSKHSTHSSSSSHFNFPPSYSSAFENILMTTSDLSPTATIASTSSTTGLSLGRPNSTSSYTSFGSPSTSSGQRQALDQAPKLPTSSSPTPGSFEARFIAFLEGNGLGPESARAVVSEGLTCASKVVWARKNISNTVQFFSSGQRGKDAVLSGFEAMQFAEALASSELEELLG